MIADRYYYTIGADPRASMILCTKFECSPLRVFEEDGHLLLDADGLQLGCEDFASAENLLRQMEGALRIDQSPINGEVKISGCWYQPSGGEIQKSARASASLGMAAAISHQPDVLTNGERQPRPASLAARIMSWLPGAEEMEDRLILMMIKGEPDWRDMTMILEIIKKIDPEMYRNHEAEFRRITHAANNWKATGVHGRHAKYHDELPTDAISLTDSRALVMECVKSFFESETPVTYV